VAELWKSEGGKARKNGLLDFLLRKGGGHSTGVSFMSCTRQGRDVRARMQKEGSERKSAPGK